MANETGEDVPLREDPAQPSIRVGHENGIGTAGLSDDLDSNVQKPGFVIYFQVLEEVRIHGVRVIAKGARVRGRLLDSQDRTRMGQVARLEWNIMDVEAVDGQRLPLRGGSGISGDELSGAKDVAVGRGKEFLAFTHGQRKVNVLYPLMPASKTP